MAGSSPGMGGRKDSTHGNSFSQQSVLRGNSLLLLVSLGLPDVPLFQSQADDVSR